jgi:hypothetical protein
MSTGAEAEDIGTVNFTAGEGRARWHTRKIAEIHLPYVLPAPKGAPAGKGETLFQAIPHWLTMMIHYFKVTFGHFP